MKKLLLIALVNGITILNAMEYEKVTKQEKEEVPHINLSTFVQECYPESSQKSESKLPVDYDAENKNIIALFDKFAASLSKTDQKTQKQWCEVMPFFTTNIVLKSNIPCLIEGWQELQHIFSSLSSPRKKRWQDLIGYARSKEGSPLIENPFELIYKKNTLLNAEKNFFSQRVKAYLGSIIIVDHLAAVARTNNMKEFAAHIQAPLNYMFFAELMRLYKNDEELNSLLPQKQQSTSDTMSKQENEEK